MFRAIFLGGSLCIYSPFFLSDAIAIPLSSMHYCNNSRMHDCLCHVLLFCSLVSPIIFFVTHSGKDGRETYKYILQCMACTLLHNSTDKSKSCRLIAMKLKRLSNSVLRKTGGLLVVTQNRLIPLSTFSFSVQNSLNFTRLSFLLRIFVLSFFPFFLLHFISFVCFILYFSLLLS